MARSLRSRIRFAEFTDAKATCSGVTDADTEKGPQSSPFHYHGPFWKSSGALDVLGRALAVALIRDDLEADLLAVDQAAHPAALYRRSVHEHVGAAVVAVVALHPGATADPEELLA